MAQIATGRSFDVEWGDQRPENFDWLAWRDLLVYCLRLQSTEQDLIEYWRANALLIDYVRKQDPELFGVIKDAFSKRKAEIKNG